MAQPVVVQPEEVKPEPVAPVVNTPTPPPIPPVSKPMAPPPLVKSGLSSIEKLKQQIAERKKEEALKQPELETQPTTQVVEENTALTEDGFSLVWENYLMELQKDRKMSLAVVFKNAQWKLVNENMVELILASQHEKELYEEEQYNVIPFMRKNLRHSLFEFKITVNSTIIKHRVFTAEEKFNAMAEKNPLLNDLRNLLALDLEY